jgi:hypothetical protein
MAGPRPSGFYRITPGGCKTRGAARRNWQDFVSAIDGVVLKPV